MPEATINTATDIESYTKHGLKTLTTRHTQTLHNGVLLRRVSPGDCEKLAQIIFLAVY